MCGSYPRPYAALVPAETFYEAVLPSLPFPPESPVYISSHRTDRASRQAAHTRNNGRPAFRPCAPKGKRRSADIYIHSRRHGTRQILHSRAGSKTASTALSAPDDPLIFPAGSPKKSTGCHFAALREGLRFPLWEGFRRSAASSVYKNDSPPSEHDCKLPAKALRNPAPALHRKAQRASELSPARDTSGSFHFYSSAHVPHPSESSRDLETAQTAPTLDR